MMPPTPVQQFKVTVKLAEFLVSGSPNRSSMQGSLRGDRRNLFAGVSGGLFLDGAAAIDSLTLLVMKPVSILFYVLSTVGWCVSAPAQAGTSKSDAFARSTQMIVVTTLDWNAIEGRLRRYERATVHEEWRPVGDPISIVVGKNGLGWGIGVIATSDSNFRLASEPVKREGDGKSPAGVFALGTAFGYSSQPLLGFKMPYLNLTPSIECVDDTGSKYYNRIVDRSVVAPDWNSSEHMRNVGESYRWGIVVDFNGIVTGGNASPPVPGGGSCVFLHIWHSHDQGTAGCTAMPQRELEALLTWLDSARKPLLVQLPEPTYERLINRWMLPKLTDVPQR
jgi:L,D-peptidoglycan transpeptidase YkuD (ErfK/YbiS/YcfS/YnhG family)